MKVQKLFKLFVIINLLLLFIISSCNIIEKTSQSNKSDLEKTTDLTEEQKEELVKIKLPEEEKIITCSSGWKCKDTSYKGYQLLDCSWITLSYCNNGCDAGDCKLKQICTPNIIECNGNWLKKCDNDGFKWNNYYKYCSYGCENETCNEKPIQQYPYDLSLCKGSADCFVGKVSYIVDGDTLDVNEVRIRLTLTNTPERGYVGFNEATQFTKNLCPIGSYVLVDEDDGQTNGSRGRTVAVVYCGNYNLNEQLLELGYGKITWTKYCRESEFGNENWAIKFGC